MIKYILRDIFETVKEDVFSSGEMFTKPREMLNTIFLLIVIMLFTNHYTIAWILIGLYFVVYIWRILRQGRWRNYKKQDLVNPQNHH